MLPAAVIVALAFAVRLAWVLIVPTKPVGDFAMYWESAAHLVEHGAFDAEYVYMPGYVALLAAVKAMGGGLLAAKMVGAAFGTLGVGAVYGITRHLWGRREALVASLLCIVWPSGVMVASVTGTDMPAAALIGTAGFCLVHWRQRRPLLGAMLFGVIMGLAATIRAVALPLVPLGAFYLRAVGMPWRALAKQAGIAFLGAALVLAPWAIRNKHRYGDLFFTDSHGGLTALVGANPNSEARYSRSLNRMFHEVTGFKLLAEPHRITDQVAYGIAREWTAFQPAYALGLVALKAERLLAPERSLLYWPLFRAGVLREPHHSWFAERRRQIEAAVDVFWAALVALALGGLGIAVARRRWELLAFVPLQLALIGLYALFFAEPRYRLPIVLLLFPSAGAALVWLADGTRRLWRERRIARDLLIDAIGAVAFTAVLLGTWSLLVEGGRRLREAHQWAVHVCHVEGVPRFCSWRASGERVGGRGSGLLGVWNGVGLAIPDGSDRLGRELIGRAEISLPPGRYRIEGSLDAAPLVSSGPALAGSVAIEAGARNEGAPVQLDLAPIEEESRRTRAVPFEAIVDHRASSLTLDLRISSKRAGTSLPPVRVWLSDLRIRRE